ncbi:PREDICTED: putative Myb family transcription factor At1g14600 isoform X3 [Camelina sativa]|uniref:Myb family transcription factor At1g14600 isoform X3 n=1 Tax=Camelina sativa TaxID=90675 RepID=A0ABM0ZCV3_CAMSA|nr:PREDICTED: putative Myb family transcription factor At1g14600 isoform X3 [Camelina sativa]
MMDVKGLTISHVKSHLQMYRGSRLTLGKPEEESSSSSSIRRRRRQESEEDHLSLHSRNDCLLGFHSFPLSSHSPSLLLSRGGGGGGGRTEQKQTTSDSGYHDVDDHDFLPIFNLNNKTVDTTTFPSHHLLHKETEEWREQEQEQEEGGEEEDLSLSLSLNHHHHWQSSGSTVSETSEAAVSTCSAPFVSKDCFGSSKIDLNLNLSISLLGS